MIFVNTLAKKKLKTAFGLKGNPHSNPFNQKESVSCIVFTNTGGKMVNFGNFARIASPCVEFHLDTLLGSFFHQGFWPNLDFSLQHQIKFLS